MSAGSTDASQEGSEEAHDAFAPPPSDDVELARVQAALEQRLLGATASHARIGRFTLLERLGSGGMGIVHAAYDEQLKRRIAIKLLHAAPGEHSPAHLVDEARAMARLSHPNVATVHEIGEHDGRAFVAMELLRGVTLRAWQRARPRSYLQVLGVYVQAGRGLAAAHAAGLVHRDFKPDNAMIDEEGTVKVLDFGLARALGAPLHNEPTLETALSDDEDQALTRSGMLAGTPAYMSPEQLEGEPADAASDQFAFCVSMWEALFGQRPFVAKTVPALVGEVTAGKIAAPPRGAKVPAWLRAVVRRGLASDPGARWPSMAALLQALQRGRARAQWRRGLVAAASLVLAAGAIAGLRQWDRQARIDACERSGQSIAEVWNEAAHDRLHAALAADGRPQSAITADKVLPWLDDHASKWQAARTEACIAATVEGRFDASVLERSEWCLDERRMELASLVTELSQSGGEANDRAVQAASGLAPIDPCLDADLLVRLPSPPADTEPAMAGLRADLSRARTLQRLGKYPEGVALARDLLQQADGAAFPPLVADVRLALGELLQAAGDLPGSEEALEAAYFEGARAGALDVAAAAADQLAYVVGLARGRHDDGFLWARHAELALASLPDHSQLRDALHATNLAAVHMAKGEYPAAKPLVERALKQREAALGPDHPEVAGSLNNLANVNEAMGTFDEAKAQHLRAIAIQEQAFGPEHPGVARSLNNLANVVSSMGDYDEAERLHLRAIAIQEVALGPNHPELSGSFNNLAGVHWARGELAEAKPLVERALAIRIEAYGPDHPEVGAAMHGLAMLHEATGELEQAKELYERSMAIREKALGPEHPEMAKSLTNLAAVEQALGNLVTARALHERALAIREKGLGPEHPDVGKSLHNLASVLRAAGTPEEAKVLYERALKIQEAALGPEHPNVAATKKALAELSQGGDEEEAQ